MAAVKHIFLILGVVAVLSAFSSATRTRTVRKTRLVIPTKESLPTIADALGAASYEETLETEPAESKPAKRVQRKLPMDGDPDLDPQPNYMEYQGVMGRPGLDFPVLPSIPRTDFSCRNVKSSGYYADLDTGCQVFHICDGGRKISFLCPNGTIFRQSHLICDWWFRVDCGKSIEQYEESAELLAHDQMAYKRRNEELAKAMEANTGTMNKPQPSGEVLQRVDEERARNAYVQRRNNRPVQTTSLSPTMASSAPLPERERQVLAETGSFTKQRHRFGSPSEAGYTRNPYSVDSGRYSTTTQRPLAHPLTHSTTNKPVFTIRVKPDREFSLVELHRQEESAKLSPTSNYPSVQFVTSRPKVSTPSFNSIPKSRKNSYSTPYFSVPEFTLATTELPPYYSHSLTIDSHLNDTEIDFIRPEVINALMDESPRLGTPTPASAVNTLHSLASYYESASAEINGDLYKSNQGPPPVSELLLRSNQPPPTTERPAPPGSNNFTVLPSVLTKATQDSYSFLFKGENKSNESQNASSSNITAESNTNDIKNSSQKKQQVGSKSAIDQKKSSYYKETQHLKESTDLRELAQVFTRALSAYLEDPESFKEILAQVRPTEPNSKGVTTPNPEDEVLQFSDDNKDQQPEISPLDINNLASAAKNIEQDNSIESIEQRKPETLTSTPIPTSIAQDINEFVANFTGELYSALGSSEDKSYFPTASGVSDNTRPRYGGFQNNSQGDHNAGRDYRPYGADLPSNITGAPLAEIPTTITPREYQRIPETLDLPEALGVNSLASQSAQPSSEELTEFTPGIPIDQPVHSAFVGIQPQDHEALLVTSGTQSFINPKDFKYTGKDSYYPSIYGPFPYGNQVAGESKNINQQSNSDIVTLYPTTSAYSNDFINGDHTTLPPEVETYSTQEPLNYQQYTTYQYHEQYQNVDLGNGITIERTLQQEHSPWGITTEEPVRPTTYHPTDSPYSVPEPVLEERAKEMFGGLNASAAGHLMNVMMKAEQNTTIRKLVLLLVSDASKDNVSVEESRSNLIQALLTSDESEMLPKQQVREPSREEHERYSVTAARYRTGKSLDGDTAVRGANIIPTTYMPTTTYPTTVTESPRSLSLQQSLPTDSDARAVELLKSLYNLAAKWG